MIANVVRGLVLALCCLALFDTPAAYIAARGGSPWLSLAAGLATFPITALIWHTLGERKRRRAPPAKPMTTGWERLLLRGATVGVLVVATLAAIAGPRRVWSAVRHHALWFLPDRTGPLVADSKLFDHVPADAEGLLWVRLDEGTRSELASALPEVAEVSRALRVSGFLVAAGEHGVLLAEQGDSELIPWVSELVENLEDLAHEHGFPSTLLPTGARATAPDGVRYLVSEGWKLPDKRVTRLTSLVEKAPSDAFAVVVASSPREGVTSMVGYARVRRGTLELALAIEATEAATAAKELGKSLDELDGNACWKRLGHSSVQVSDGRVEASLKIALEDLRTVIECDD